MSEYLSLHSSSFMPTIPLNDSAIFLSSSILANFCKSLFRLLDLPDAIPPFLPISRSSLGLRSVFGIKFELFTFNLLSRFVRALSMLQYSTRSLAPPFLRAVKSVISFRDSDNEGYFFLGCLKCLDTSFLGQPKWPDTSF